MNTRAKLDVVLKAVAAERKLCLHSEVPTESFLAAEKAFVETKMLVQHEGMTTASTEDALKPGIRTSKLQKLALLGEAWDAYKEQIENTLAMLNPEADTVTIRATEIIRAISKKIEEMVPAPSRA
jgi:hypothetical protein